MLNDLQHHHCNASENALLFYLASKLDRKIMTVKDVCVYERVHVCV